MKRMLATVFIAALAPAGQAACLPIVGTAQLSEDGACRVRGYFSLEVPFVGAPECYKTTIKLGGILPSSGYSGVTAEPGPVAVQGDRAVLTARSTFSIGGTRIYAAEVIVQSGAVVTEQSVITGTDGRGLFKNASGYFHILGNSIGQPAQVYGQLCLP